MNEIDRKSDTLGNLIIVLMVMISIWSLSPWVRSHIYQGYILILAVLCLTLMICRNDFKIDSRFFSIIILVMIRIIYKVLGISNESWANHSNAFIFFFMMYTAIYLFENFDYERIRGLTKTLLIISVVGLGQQFFAFAENGFQSLYSESDLLDDSIVAGGTSYVTAVMFLGMICAIVIFQNKDLKKRILAGAIMIASIYYILFIQTRATALIILVLFIAACIFFGTEEKTSVTRMFVFIIFAIVFLFLLQTILNAIISSGSDYYARKFTAISDFLSGDISINESSLGESSLVERLYYASVSLRTWSSNIIIFLFGKGYDSGFYNTSGIGRHSELVDLLPRYGLLGFILTAYVFHMFYKAISSYLNSNKGYFMIFVSFIVYSVLNGILFPDIGCAFLWVAPLTIFTHCNDVNCKYED